jgi:hypothetical protein
VVLSESAQHGDNTHRVGGSYQLLVVGFPTFYPCVVETMERVFVGGHGGGNQRQHMEMLVCIFHICRLCTQRGLPYADCACDAG